MGEDKIRKTSRLMPKPIPAQKPDAIWEAREFMKANPGKPVPSRIVRGLLAGIANDMKTYDRFSRGIARVMAQYGG